jgi:hypothetical protein
MGFRGLMVCASVERHCTRCRLEKSEGDFHSNGKNGRYSICRGCRKLIRESKRDYYRDLVKQRQANLRRIVMEHKSGPCVDCRLPYEPFLLEFDHVRGEKTLSIANVWKRNWSVSRLLDELAKCELVCIGCHRLRTAKRTKSPPLLVMTPEAIRSRARKAHIKQTVNTAKHKPCKDCGNKYPPILMDFDHRDPATKLFEISEARRNGMSLIDLLAEIDKCDVICCWCHARRDHRSGQEAA